MTTRSIGELPDLEKAYLERKAVVFYFFVDNENIPFAKNFYEKFVFDRKLKYISILKNQLKRLT